jgi:hypothetical protein
MKNHNRATSLGIATLGAIAVLGWVREPQPRKRAEIVSTSVIQPPARTQAPTAFSDIDVELPSRDFEAEREVVPRSIPRRARLAETPTAVSQPKVLQTRPVSPAPAPKTASTSEIPSRPAERSSVEEPPPYVPETRQPVPDKQTAPVVAARKGRTTQQRALIIGGAGAAGAVIGAAAGGRKGAAIGAIAGLAGGYVYDRVSGRGDSGAATYGNSPAPGSNRDLVTRFGTPSYY